MVARRDESYAPERGDIVWVDLGVPAGGREQAGERPALVISPQAYNHHTGFLLACPITSKERGYAFEVSLPDDGEITGVVLSNHVRNYDWQERGARQAGAVPPQIVAATLGKLQTLLL